MPRSAVLQLGERFERLCLDCGVKAVVGPAGDKLFFISGPLHGLLRFQEQVAASRWYSHDGQTSGNTFQAPALRSERLDDDGIEQSRNGCNMADTVEHVPIDVDKLSGLLAGQPSLLQECSHKGVRLHFPALCAEGDPHDRAQSIAVLREELSRWSPPSSFTNTPGSAASRSGSREGTTRSGGESREVETAQPRSESVPMSIEADVTSEVSMAGCAMSGVEPCHIAIAEPEPDIQSHSSGHLDPPLTLMRWRAQRPDVIVEVRFGDLVHEHVDAIVNPANERLQHLGGVAAAIVEAGGESIIRESNELVTQSGELSVTEVAPTKAGRLPCRHVLHTVGPRYVL